MANLARILHFIERTDQKIENLESLSEDFARAASRNEIGPDGNVEFAIEDPLCVGIDDIVTDLWDTLALVIPLLQSVRFSRSCLEAQGCWELPYPPIEYGPENKSATPVIDGIARHACKTDALCDILNQLVSISDKPHRKLGVATRAVSAFRRHGGHYSEKTPHDPVAIFIRKDDDTINNTSLKAIAEAPDGSGIVATLSGINEGIRTFVENLNS
jgi:hypothetical protein